MKILLETSHFTLICLFNFLVVPVVNIYRIALQVTNLAGTDVLLDPDDREDNLLVKSRQIVLIKMTTKQSTTVTFTVLNAKTKEKYYINGAESFGVIPTLVADIPEPLTITRTGKYFFCRLL